MAADGKLTNSAKMARITVDGREIAAEEGVPLLQAMLDAGLDIPHYCYHPKLTIDGSCRLCQVRVEGIPKLQISCNTPVKDAMVVHTAEPEVAMARRGVLELLLLNHPLDCPICDKAGECWLQNFAVRFGSRFSRAMGPRRKLQKRLDIGERMLLDQERCILCRRCVRFCREITKTGELAVFNIGDRSVLDIYDRRLDNDYSMCTADICPVGALETKDFHHKIRVWFLDETASVCPSCSNGCNIMVCEARGRIWRLLPRRNDAVNDTWMCDAGRLNYGFVMDHERLRAPMAAEADGLKETEWSVALERAAAAIAGLTKTHGAKAFGALVSPHLTNEENYRFGELLRAIGAQRIAMAVPKGKSDDFLIKAEKAPNARGVRELGLVGGDDDGVEALLRACESGEIRGLYLCGDDLLATGGAERIAPLLERLDLLIVQTLKRRPEYERAAAIFPTTTFAEKDGTFTNHAGRVQRIQKAIEPPPGWLCDGDIFTRILNLLESRHERFELPRIWDAMERDGTAFARVRFNDIGPHGAALAGAEGDGGS
ncbi:MAG TPA: 2Fe-2S iron-sulfur cluster-binding protein [Candidatus Binataceae bacterium]|nr:2Fe-2S iron-sulfur cluster-binding protein [Candidatus Binataceae bacterium]